MEYLRHLIADIQATVPSRFTLLTTPASVRRPSCQRLSSDYGHVMTVHSVSLPSARHLRYRALGAFLEEQWRCARMAEIALRHEQFRTVDFVLLPHLEAIGLLHLALRRPAFGGKPWATIAIGTRFHHRACGIEGSWRWIDPVQGFLFRRVLADPTLVRFGTIDPYLEAAAANRKVVYCPDPCPAPAPLDRAEVRRAYGLRPGAFVVLVFGVIDRRKCLDVLLEGAVRVPADIDLTVLVAGPQAKNDVGPILAGDAARELRRCGRLVELNRYVLIGPDPDPAAAADAVWVFYQSNFVYSSSVLVRAARSGRPVIARRRGVIGKQIDEHAFGVASDSEEPDAIAGALTRLARDQALRRRMGDAGMKAFAGHDPAVFARPITDGIVECFSGREAD